MPDYNFSYQIPPFSQFFGQSPNDLLGFISNLRNEGMRTKYGLEGDLMSRQLGEAGRQFDVGNQFARQQESNRNRYLDQLLSFQKQQEAQRVLDSRLNRAAPDFADMFAKMDMRKPVSWMSNTTFVPPAQGSTRI